MQAAASKRSARARATVVLPAPGIPTIKITSGGGGTTRRLARRRGAADRAPSPVKTVRPPSSYCEVMFDPRGYRRQPRCRPCQPVHRAVIEQECRLVELAAHWANLNHSADRSRTE